MLGMSERVFLREFSISITGPSPTQWKDPALLISGYCDKVPEKSILNKEGFIWHTVRLQYIMAGKVIGLKVIMPLVIARQPSGNRGR